MPARQGGPHQLHNLLETNVKSTQPYRRLSGVSALMTGLLVGCAAWAQALPAEPATAPADDGQPAGAALGAPAEAHVEQVIVTGTKRPSPQREVAGTVSVLQGKVLEDKSAASFEDYLKLTPGVQFNKGEPGSSTLSIRGVATSTSGTAGIMQGTTGVYVEDVPFTDPFSSFALVDVAPYDLARIEVLRGPQGALFGSASLGGALRYMFNRPDYEATAGSAKATVSSTAHGGFNHLESAHLNLASGGGSSAIRIAAFNRHDDGYINNSGAGVSKSNWMNQSSARLAWSVKPVPALELTAIAMVQDERSGDTSAVTAPDRYENNNASTSPRSSGFTLFNLQANYDVGDYRLTSSTANLKKTFDQNADVGMRFGHLLGGQVDVLKAPQTYESKALSQELRIATNKTKGYSFVAGAFYQRYRQHVNFDISGTGVTAASQQLYGPLVGQALAATLTSGERFYSEQDAAEATETALFAEGELELAPKLTVGAGGRFYRTKLDVNIHTAQLLNLLAFGTPATATSSSGSDSGFTPKVSVKYQFDKDNMWYALMSTGYRFGGQNALPPLPGVVTPANFKSDKLRNYETGVRLGNPRRAALDLAVFLIDWKDVQVQVMRSDGFPYLDNVGKAQVRGVEAGLSLAPTRQTSVRLTSTYTKAETSASFTGDSGVIPAGARLPGTARLQAAAEASYRFHPTDATNAILTLTATSVGRYYNDLQQSVALGDYRLVDANLAFNWGDWDVAAFANNLADSQGRVAASVVRGGTQYFMVKPRTVGLSARLSF
jgi:iron complex outermembrane receptor protein